jgi:hypothetical protein
MTQHRDRPTSSRRPSTARILRAGAPVALLLALASVGTKGQISASFYVDDLTVTEGPSGLTQAEFTITLANPNGMESSVGFTTNDGTAQGGQLTAFFPSAGPITLGDGPSSPYGVTFNVTGVTGPLTSISMLLESLAHPSPQDLDVLLVAPDGTSMVVQSDTGPAANPNTLSYILRDYNPLIANSLLGGTYGPTSRSPADVFPAPAPAGPYAEGPPEGSATMRDTFAAATTLGSWRAYINDDSPGGTGTLNRIVLTVGTPEPGTDYNDLFGRVTFPPGITTQKVRVLVNGDTTAEPDETFFLDLGVPVNGVIGKGRGIGTIRDGGSGGLPPTTVNDAYQTSVDTPLQLPAPGVLGNDMANLGGQMTAQLISQPTFGVLTLATDGSFKYIPGPNFTGTDSFTYRAVNAAGNGNVATVTITVQGGLPPTTVDDTYSMQYAGGKTFFGAGSFVLLRNDDDKGGGPLSAELVSPPANGQFTFDATGRFLYTPPDDFEGTATFTYRAVNKYGPGNIATVSIAITKGTRPPTPANLRVLSIVGNRPVVRYDAPIVSPPPTGFEIAGGTQPGETLAVVPTGSLFPIFSFNAPFGSFLLRAHSVLGTERSSPSNEVPLHMNTTVTPSAPERLLGSMDGNSLTLAWKNTFGGGIPTNAFLRVTGSASVTVPLGQTETFSFSPVPAGTYAFEVLNGNAGGVGPASNRVTLTSPGTCSPPEMPEDFLLYVNGLVLGAIWDLARGGPAPSGYLLHVTSPVFTGSVPLDRRSIEATVPPGTYTASVQATTACGASARTAEQTVVVQ